MASVLALGFAEACHAESAPDPSLRGDPSRPRKSSHGHHLRKTSSAMTILATSLSLSQDEKQSFFEKKWKAVEPALFERFRHL